MHNSVCPCCSTCTRLQPSGANHLLVLYSVISTLIASLMALLWGMGVTHTQVRAWVHQQGLAVTAGLMKLKSATKCLLVCHALCPPTLLLSFLLRALTRVLHAAARPSLIIPSALSPCHYSLCSLVFPMLQSPPVLTMLQQRGIFPMLLNTIKHARSEMERLGKAVWTVVASMGGTHEWKEAMEMRLRALGVQLEERRRELEEAERRRVAEMKGQVEDRRDLEKAEWMREIEIREMRAQVEERERLLGAELAAVKGELGAHKQSTALQLEEAERRRVAEMRGQVEERERELAAVKGQVTTVKEEVNGVKGEVKAVKGEVTEVKGEVAAMRGEVTIVQGKVNAVRREVKAVQGEVNAVKGEVIAVKGDVTTVQAEGVGGG
ncbi:unnamed protein product [Closterium sp. NIES-64]|nr:unnamed protein product [Closterium sp. NIES-64]